MATKDRPSDIFNATHSIEDLLALRGWTAKHWRADGRRYWRRPGKRRGSYSACEFQPNPYGVVVVYSTSTGLEPRWYTPFGLYVALEHRGSLVAAIQAISPKEHSPSFHDLLLKVEKWIVNQDLSWKERIVLDALVTIMHESGRLQPSPGFRRLGRTAGVSHEQARKIIQQIEARRLVSVGRSLLAAKPWTLTINAPAVTRTPRDTGKVDRSRVGLPLLAATIIEQGC